MAAAAILDNFEWPYLHNGSRSTYIVIFAIAQLSTIGWSSNVVEFRQVDGAHKVVWNCHYLLLCELWFTLLRRCHLSPNW